MTARRLLLIPAYNEGRTIGQVLLRSLPWVDEIVVVDDGSKDETAQAVRGLIALHPQIVLLQLPRNQGMSGALLAGFCLLWRWLEEGRLRPEDWIITIDADGQHVPSEIPRLVEAAEAQSADVMLGRRHLHRYPWFKRFGNWGLSLWASWLGGFRYHDVECGFRALRAEVLPDLLRYFTGRRYGCAQELAIITALRGWRVANDFPVTVPHYRTGTRIKDGLTNLWMGLQAWWAVTWAPGHLPDRRAHRVLKGVRRSGTGAAHQA